MKYKEKQIEEMAQCKNSYSLICSECGLKGGCERYILAKELYEQGYRKLTDSIVLSKEEYDELKGRAEEVFNEMTERMKAEVKIAKKMGVIKGSKETAEKFLQLAYDRCLEKSFIKKVEELAKQFGGKKE